MNRPQHPATPQPEPTILMTSGWHCLHLYYSVDQAALRALPKDVRARGSEQLIEILDPERDGAPTRLQTSIVSGQKADLCVLVMDPDPLVLDGVDQQIRASMLGTVLQRAYSFVSISEVSEYVPTLEQYGARLVVEGDAADSPEYAAKIKAYEGREVAMRKQRLFPEFPDWPVMSFYPMNKIRDPHANWYCEPFSSRMSMMSEHGRSGMKFAGRVTQVITASTGMDDWEWGVTLWGRSPECIKDIVYTMRFDEASARYAEFGPFYLSYIVSPAEAVKHMRLE